MPWLSAIIPVHNGASFLDATLAAAAAEHPKDVEFLIYDSGDDNGACRHIAESYADRLEIRYEVTPECKPWTAKTNRGVAEANSSHIVMLHQDDIWLPRHLDAVRSAIAGSGSVAMSIAPSLFIDCRGRSVGRWRLPFEPGLHSGREIAKTLIVQNTIAIPSPVINREAWLAVGGMDEDLWYTADWDLYLKLAQHGEVAVRPETTTAFRLHASSLTMTGSRRQDEFAAQQNIVLDRHLPTLSPLVRAQQESLARVSVAINCALASRASHQSGAVRNAVGQLLKLGPTGIGRFLSASRLIDRTVPRLRLALGGGM